MMSYKNTLFALAPLMVEGPLQLITQTGVAPWKLVVLIFIVGALAVLNHLA